MNKIKLDKKYIIKGYITAKSGLHIGGTDAGLSIGSADSTVIKHPISGKPYIPGSTLKGKMRSLTELTRGEISEVRMGAVQNGACQDPNSLSAKLFGTANTKDKEAQRPSRVIVRDAYLSEVGNEQFVDKPYTEIKTEVVIDRITSKAMPRQLERVPSGARFDMNIVLNVFTENDQSNDMINDVFGALELVQDDYIGGSGTRGNGEVKFTITSITERLATYYSKNKQGSERDVIADFQTNFPNLF